MQKDIQSLDFDIREDSSFKPKRILLKDQTTKLLRRNIVNGRIPPGTKLVEHKIADMFAISRAPVRDALLELEKEGLIVTKSNGRYVIELSERDIRELYQVRLSLEKMAVELAAQNTSPKNRAELLAKLKEMKEATIRNDSDVFTRDGLEMHQLIWVQADNRHLLKTLNSMVGPIFMFISINAKYYDWNKTLEKHEDLVASINSGDAKMAVKNIERDLNDSLNRSLEVLQKEIEPSE